MSRVAKQPIYLPEGVELVMTEEKLSVKGPKGTLEQGYNKLVKISKSKKDGALSFNPKTADAKGWAQAGTVRALVNNMIKGVTIGFERTLELVGVGYRVQASGNKINLSLGYSHTIAYGLPESIKAEIPNITTIVLRGSDKQLLGQVASEIRGFRAPEPYKGKGVKYLGEIIVRKEAKKNSD